MAAVAAANQSHFEGGEQALPVPFFVREPLQGQPPSSWPATHNVTDRAVRNSDRRACVSKHRSPGDVFPDCRQTTMNAAQFSGESAVAGRSKSSRLSPSTLSGRTSAFSAAAGYTRAA